ncbi:PREDICTED: mitochondrial inner membrane protein OXA1-like isoform X2 [Tarenaya hassleriana]|nr:PREDICTED: mitochondrial inner membrane protein OXA1-like isoform X2 [Tarenaya hassleriana]
MAFRRGLSIRSTLSARRYQPSPCYIITHNNDCDGESFCQTPSQRSYHSFLHQRSSSNNSASSQMSWGCSHLSLFPTSGFAFHRYMSSFHGDGSDIPLVVTDTTLQTVTSQATGVYEFSDSFFPVDALRNCIGMVHSFTGLDWWVSIVLSTLFIRAMLAPLFVKQIKATTKLMLVRSQLPSIGEDMKKKGMDPTSIAEGQQQMEALYKKHGIGPLAMLAPMMGLFIQGPVFLCFFLAVRGMVEKVPSFQTGGAFWFTDLTTPDSLYILPVLTGLTAWMHIEFNVEAGKLLKNIGRGYAFLAVPLTMGFPAALFFYWITSNLFTLMFGVAVKRPLVKKVLGIPELPPLEPSSDPTSDPEATASRTRRYPLVNPRVLRQGSISERLKALERQVKNRKKITKS